VNLTQQVRKLEREKLHCETVLALRKRDKDTRLAELTQTVRVLALKGDAHMQLANARSEVETERLTVFHLQCEVENYREMLKDEQRRSLELNRELAELKGLVCMDSCCRLLLLRPN
jgi:hypothetical protein